MSGGSRAREKRDLWISMVLWSVIVAAGAGAVFAQDRVAKAFACGAFAMFGLMIVKSIWMSPCRCKHCGKLSHKDDEDDGPPSNGATT